MLRAFLSCNGCTSYVRRKGYCFQFGQLVLAKQLHKPYPPFHRLCQEIYYHNIRYTVASAPMLSSLIPLKYNAVHSGLGLSWFLFPISFSIIFLPRPLIKSLTQPHCSLLPGVPRSSIIYSLGLSWFHLVSFIYRIFAVPSTSNACIRRFLCCGRYRPCLPHLICTRNPVLGAKNLNASVRDIPPFCQLGN